MRYNSLHRQKGVTLIVGLIMLVLIMLMVTTTYTLSGSSLKSVGNMQFRNESIAAANKAAEQYINTYFDATMASLPSTTITFDINNDGTADYSVAMAAPVCIQANTVAGVAVAGACSSATLDDALGGCASAPFSTLWDLDATVTDVASGSSVRIRQGLRLQLSSDDKTRLCP